MDGPPGVNFLELLDRDFGLDGGRTPRSASRGANVYEMNKFISADQVTLSSSVYRVI
jgi:hypothetical protein